jgi:3-hydroxyisobutyrate dehydrogenase-like beta-hydroxyacid dehydrogenase
MARNLIKAGHSLTVYNRTRSRAEEFKSLGAAVAETPGEAASDRDALITMLADDHALEKVMFDPGNAIQSLPAGAIHISMSTISVALAPVYRNYGGMIAADKFEPVGFSLPLGFKDNRLLLAAAEEAQVPVPMASLVHDRFLAALAQGLGEADWAAIARISFQAAGLLGSAASSKDCS